MKTTETYIQETSHDHMSQYGQFFTPDYIVKLMTDWILEIKPNKILDPAVGNNCFFKEIDRNGNYFKSGYELDKKIITYFNLENVYDEDFLLSTWDEKFDAIIANPPYAKFQKINHRHKYLQIIKDKTGINMSGLSNLSLYFFIKCIFQLNINGRLAFIMPYEFLDGAQGKVIKQFLIENKLLHSIIYCKFNNIFTFANTTAAIFLIEKKTNKSVKFYYIDSREKICDYKYSNNQISLDYDFLSIDQKWSNLHNKPFNINNNLIMFKDIVKVTRGIATGHNQYFLLDEKTINKYNIPAECFVDCIHSSTQVKDLFFTENTKLTKHKYLFYPNLKTSSVATYLQYGIDLKVNERYLCSHRKLWYMVEMREPAHIWISTAFRDKIKTVRNLTNFICLTTFHNIYIKNNYKSLTNILFCYFQTDICQKLLTNNLRTLGNGLSKIQPSDISGSYLINITKISLEDQNQILKIYEKCKEKQLFSKQDLRELNEIFLKYF